MRFALDLSTLMQCAVLCVLWRDDASAAIRDGPDMGAALAAGGRRPAELHRIVGVPLQGEDDRGGTISPTAPINTHDQGECPWIAS
ncbi:MAG: hypothetical protein ACXWZF_02430 [Actinomycetota bacterium]